MRSTRTVGSWWGWLACGLVLIACNDDAGTPTLPDADGNGIADFVSARPDGSGGASSGSAAGAAGTAGTASGVDSDDSGGDGASRAIAEADILQLDGDRIYALSRYSGLSIIDASDPRALRLEGDYRSTAVPFEMYVADGTVFAMFNAYYTYECNGDAGECEWRSTSRVQALDVRDPARIVRLSDEVVPGTLVDSRRVGDVLYIATLEDGYCWRCENTPRTLVTSFDVADPSRLERVDQLAFAADAYAGQRSIAVTEQRIYISGWNWSSEAQAERGSIQVVDITDPGGQLVAGATIPIAGQIQSRWQMDEHDGVLRVISQPDGWGSSTPPVLETFRVESANALPRLASLSIRLPRPNEVLTSARFDGARAYAITAEQTDPLFTFDLSDPANPRQVGELEMPGWVYHMEPRGDRLFALGFDNQNPAGSLHVSLFDVSDLNEPRLLSRVAFGGDWGSFAEDQDRIHKAFSILDDSGLILVPFAGGTYDETTCYYDYGSGIQLVDFTNDGLTKRGVAPQVGSARRALLHRGHLFGIGDNAVQTFDISDRDAPAPVGRLDVARNISSVRVLGEHLMRFGNDWWTNQTTLDMTPLARASVAEPQAEIDLSALFGENTWSCGATSEWGGQVFTHGDYAYVPRYSYRYTEGAQASQQRLTLYVIDLSDRNDPRPIGTLPMESLDGGSYFSGIIQTENTLLVGRGTGFVEQKPRYFYDVIDLAEPAAPAVVSRFEVPEALASGGFGYYPMRGCMIDVAWGWYGGGRSGGAALTDGDLVISHHSEPVEGSDRQVRYYLDRIDVSDPQQPRFLPKVSIPGSVLHFNAGTGEIVTLDYQEEIVPFDYERRSCYNLPGPGVSYPAGDGSSCRVVFRSLNSLVLEGDRAVRKSELPLDRESYTESIAVSDERVFYTTSDYREGGVGPAQNIRLNVLRLVDGSLEALAPVDLGFAASYWTDLRARGARVFQMRDSELRVIDTSAADSPVQATFELPAYSYCTSLEVAGDWAYCALGQRGVEAFDLSAMR
jgi:uncharacterized secreted protein with C-terminal beta-propeller domain